MFSKFLNMDTEKQNRILNASMKEFAQKGFDLASTNEIVKGAEISKGLLFHYFNNKKDLFLFIYDYGVELIKKDINGKINLAEEDFFVRIRELSRIKLAVLNQYPEIFRFLEVAYLETSGVVHNDLDRRKKEQIEEGTATLFEGIDYSKFREGLDLKKVINIIIWTFESFGNQELAKAKEHPSTPLDYEKLWVEADSYTQLFKDTFYK